MSATRISCPNCKFQNQARDTRCLMCKEPLPAAAVGAAPPAPARAAASAGRAAPPTARRRPPPPAATPRVEPVLPKEGAEIVAWLCCDPLPPIPLGPEPSLSIGRTEPARLVLPHKEVSRRHALIKVHGKALLIEDEGSSNGIYLNGQRVSSASIKVGDKLLIGPYELEIRSHEQMAQPIEGSTPEALTSVQLLQPDAAMSGRLEEVEATELLQQLEFTEKTGTLAIRGPGGLEGELVVRRGRPLRARLGTARDGEAVIQIALLRAGRFTFTGTVTPGQDRIEGAITGLLLEASRRRDEGTPAGEEPEAQPAEEPPGEELEQSPATEALEEAGFADEASAPEGAPGTGGDEGAPSPGEGPERGELPKVGGEMTGGDWQSFWDA